MYETMNEISRNNKSLNSITHGIFALHYITLGRSFLALLPTRIAIVTEGCIIWRSHNKPDGYSLNMSIVLLHQDLYEGLQLFFFINFVLL
jgi:hypothetical protein